MDEKNVTIIKNGLVVSGSGNRKVDLIIHNGKISSVVNNGVIEDKDFPDAKIYNANGKWVLPGLVEPHMHIAAPLGGVIDIMNFESASRVAAYGGVTTFMDFSSTLPGMSIRKAVQDRLEEMKISKQDYSVHAKIVSLISPTTIAEQMNANAKLFDATQLKNTNLSNMTDSQLKDLEEKIKKYKEEADRCDTKVREELNERLEEIPVLIQQDKIPTFKLFMTYRKAHVMIDDVDMLRVMKKVTECGGMVGFHAESNPIAEYNDEEFGKNGYLTPEAFADSKPNICEAEAVARVLTFAKMLNANIYFFHITTKESVDLIRKAKSEGVKVHAETCTHYLTLTKDRYKDPDVGRLYMMSPPLRSKEDCEALWNGINDGTLSIVSSDNCTFTHAQKCASNDYRKIISGTSGLGERLGLLLGEGVAKNRITLNKLVEIACENPAKLFGIYPKKGCLLPGADADITIIDPKINKELTCENLHYPDELDYSIYKGFKSFGWPVLVLRRGEILMKDDQYNSDCSSGDFLEGVL